MSGIELAAPAAAGVIGAAMAGAAAQAVTGFGFSLVASPVFVLLIGPLQAVRLTNIFAIVVNAMMLVREHAGIRGGQAIRLLIPAAVVTPPAAWLVHRTDPAVMSIVVGLVVVVCAVALMSGRRAEHLRGGKGIVAAGAISAAMNTASGVGGPAVAMYALNDEWDQEQARPTMALFFIGLNVLSLFALGLVSIPVPLAAGMVAATAVGFSLGLILLRRMGPTLLARVILILSMIGGLAAAARGVFAL